LTESRQRGRDAFVRAITLLREKVESFERYPFSIPAIRALDSLDLHPKVTFFVGENGSGKAGWPRCSYRVGLHRRLLLVAGRRCRHPLLGVCRRPAAACLRCARTAARADALRA